MQLWLEKDTPNRIGATGFDAYADIFLSQRTSFQALENEHIRLIFLPSSDETDFDATYDLEELL